MIAKKRDDVHLLIVGNDEEGYGEKVKRWLREYGLGYNETDQINQTNQMDAKVIFTGMLTGKDKLMVLQDSDIFVLPSYSENFGMAVVEAMTCGLPVVISNKVGIYREVEKNKAGIVVNIDIGKHLTNQINQRNKRNEINQNAESLYKGIELLLENSELKKEIAINGRKLVEEYYDIDKVADMMIEAYEEVLNNAKQ